ncbi:hypothetical protein PUNSTDRAFT_133582 [Punctularia strigosozonata HHB-11173 SS5]|uniref:uncharacterized protein n=1 Tax=Punctularia strigosozonata (strain HHB-11173) TaxID=741275 RepID=UPI0004417915|nr:uncharacterized protein PUNSTDRAFT_133582 [Punctularia strigosozonata HHB-11173 SS5]EIN09811.1 hypothetical protein PUNSTDRAFT_133582 [Punctularia strigosozonata HHB-11173 SS5]
MNVAFAVKWHENIANITNPVQAAQRTWAHSPYTKVEWVSQIFDNGYASALFLWKIKGGFHHAASDSGRVTNGSMDSLSGRLRMLFWIALTNFVFPVVFNLVQIIIIFSKNSFFVGAYIMMVNTFVSILGVVFATVWSSSLKARGPTTTFSRSQTGRTLPLIFKHTVTDSDTLGKSRDSSNGFDRTNAKVPSNFDEMPLETIALGKAD